jgi:hypothetical protein
MDNHMISMAVCQLVSRTSLCELAVLG